MPAMDCPNCDGSGYVEAADGTTAVCARCDGTGVVFIDEEGDEAEIQV